MSISQVEGMSMFWNYININFKINNQKLSNNIFVTCSVQISAVSLLQQVSRCGKVESQLLPVEGVKFWGDQYCPFEEKMSSLEM